MSYRICSKCGESKPETTEFFSLRGTKDRGGLRPDCNECRKKQHRAYYQANREKFQAYKEAHAGHIAAYMAAYMPTYERTANGRAARKRASTKWGATPAGRLSQVMAAQRRRARVLGASGEFTLAEWFACLTAFDYHCAYCGVRGPVTQEHVLPISRGGLHDRSNIVSACKSCNSQKFSKLLVEWFPRQPFFSEERLVRIADYLGLWVS